MEEGRFRAAWRASAEESGDWKGKESGEERGQRKRETERPGEGLRAPEKRPQISSLSRGGESPKSSSPRGGPDRDPQPPRSRRLWPPPPEAGGRESRTGLAGGGRGLEGGGPHSLRFLHPSSPGGGHPGYLSGGGPAAPPPPPPIQEAAPLSAPAQGARRASERTFRAFSYTSPGHYAAEQWSPSPPSAPPAAPPAARAAQLSAGGGVAQPSADGTLAAGPQRLLKSKIGGGRRPPRALRGRCLGSPPQPRGAGGRG